MSMRHWQLLPRAISPKKKRRVWTAVSIRYCSNLTTRTWSWQRRETLAPRQWLEIRVLNQWYARRALIQKWRTKAMMLGNEMGRSRPQWSLIRPSRWLTFLNEKKRASETKTAWSLTRTRALWKETNPISPLSETKMLKKKAPSTSSMELRRCFRRRIQLAPSLRLPPKRLLELQRWLLKEIRAMTQSAIRKMTTKHKWPTLSRPKRTK